MNLPLFFCPFIQNSHSVYFRFMCSGRLSTSLTSSLKFPISSIDYLILRSQTSLDESSFCLRVYLPALSRLAWSTRIGSNTPQIWYSNTTTNIIVGRSPYSNFLCCSETRLSNNQTFVFSLPRADRSPAQPNLQRPRAQKAAHCSPRKTSSTRGNRALVCGKGSGRIWKRDSDKWPPHFRSDRR